MTDFSHTQELITDPSKGLTFSQALAWIIPYQSVKQGGRIARAIWNGTMWACHGAGAVCQSDKFWNRYTREFAEQNGGYAEVLPYLILKTADNKIQMGWSPSQADIMTCDWMVLPD